MRNLLTVGHDDEEVRAAKLDGDLIGRVPLFNPTVGAAAEVKRPLLVVRDVDVRLTFEAATALNGIFGVEAVVEGFPIGEATVLTFVFGSGH